VDLAVVRDKELVEAQDKGKDVARGKELVEAQDRGKAVDEAWDGEFGASAPAGGLSDPVENVSVPIAVQPFHISRVFPVWK
jgi:hypothetical protein